MQFVKKLKTQIKRKTYRNTHVVNDAGGLSHSDRQKSDSKLLLLGWNHGYGAGTKFQVSVSSQVSDLVREFTRHIKRKFRPIPVYQ